MPIRNGKWNVTIDGAIGEMEVAAADLHGQLQGAIHGFGGPYLFRGMWNEVAQ